MFRLARLLKDCIGGSEIYLKDSTGVIDIFVPESRYLLINFSHLGYGVDCSIQVPYAIYDILPNLEETLAGMNGTPTSHWKKKIISLDNIMRSISINELKGDEQPGFDEFYANTYPKFSKNLKKKANEWLWKACYVNEEDKQCKINKLKLEIINKKLSVG